MKVKVNISVGELLDKISILEIKNEIINDEYVKRELSELSEIAEKFLSLPEYQDLKCVNRILWDIEDSLRDHENRHDFNDEFIRLARLVYHTNDKRCALKKKINENVGSYYKEIKIYSEY